MPYVFPDDVGDEETMWHFGSWMRSGGGPGDVVAWYEVDWNVDVRDILPTIRVPTLVIHRVDDRSVPIENGRYIAEHIPGARLIELPGSTHGWAVGDEIPDAVGGFIAQLRREEAEFDRVLASVLFTDIVGSTDRAAKLGDRAWRDLVQQHHSVTRGMLGRYRGAEVDTAGDGFFATFDGPARAVRCAQSIVEAVKPLGTPGASRRAHGRGGDDRRQDRRDRRRDRCTGGASTRVPPRCWVSQTVKDLVAGSGLTFEDAGEHELKGVPDRWRLYRVTG